MANINWAVVKLILKGWYRAKFFRYDQNLNLSNGQGGVGYEISLRLPWTSILVDVMENC